MKKPTRLRILLVLAAMTTLMALAALADLGRETLTARLIEVLEAQPNDHAATFTAFSPDGKRLAAGGWGHVRVWDLATRKPLITVDTWDENLALSPDGTRLAAVGRDKSTLEVWDSATGERLRTMTTPKGAAYGVVFSPDGTRLAAAGGGYGLIPIWDAADGTVLRTIETDFNVADVAFSPDGKRLAAGGMAGLKVWDVATGRELASLPTSARMVNSVAFSPDGKTLAAGGSWDRLAEVWDLATKLRRYKVTTGGITKVRFSPDGRWLATASWDDRGVRSLHDTVVVWDAASGRKLLSLQGQIEEVHSLAFSADGTRLAAGDRDGTVKVWQIVEAEPDPAKTKP